MKVGALIALGIIGLLFVQLGGWRDGRPAGGKLAAVLDGEQVELLNRLNAEWVLPSGLVVEEVELSSMKMNWMFTDETSSDRVILQLHGGAYQRSLSQNGITYQRAAAKYALISAARVLTVDYRVAPDHPFPAALEDAVAAYSWLLESGYEPDHIVIAGDSAGGGLTLAVALYLRDNALPLPAALITMSAWTDLNYPRIKIPYVGQGDSTNPYISPIYGDYVGLPPLLMQVGGAEALLDDTLSVAEMARAAGVSVQQSTYADMCHVFQMLYPALPEANTAWDEVASYLHVVFR